MFLLGLFWKKATTNAALFAAIGGFIMSLVLKFLPLYADLSFLSPIGFSKLNGGVYEIPFLDRMGFVFIFCALGMYIISKMDKSPISDSGSVQIEKSMFKTHQGFAMGACLVIGILLTLYIVFW